MFLSKYYMIICAFRTPHVCLAEITHTISQSSCFYFLTSYIWIYINMDVECVLTECCKHFFKFFSFPTHFIEVISDLIIEINLTVLTPNIVCCQYLYYTPWKISEFVAFSGPCFPTFRLSTEIYRLMHYALQNKISIGSAMPGAFSKI